MESKAQDRTIQAMERAGTKPEETSDWTKGSGPTWHKPQQCWECSWVCAATNEAACAPTTVHINNRTSKALCLTVALDDTVETIISGRKTETAVRR
jgi:hypothetical protein